MFPYVVGKGKPYRRTLWDWIRPKGIAKKEVYEKAWSRLMEHKEFVLKLARITGFEAVVVHAMYDVVVEEIKYEYDKTLGSPDYWMDSDECWGKRTGDCEDTSFLLSGCLEDITKNYQQHFGWVKLDRWYGHSWLTYRLWDNREALLETTLEKPLALSQWILTPRNFVPVVSFNYRGVWYMDEEDPMFKYVFNNKEKPEEIEWIRRKDEQHRKKIKETLKITEVRGEG